MDILHYYEIHGDKKGILQNKDIEIEISTSSGPYKKVLKRISDYIRTQIETEESLERQDFFVDNRATEISSITKTRIFQSLLRRRVLINYNNQCALCDIAKADLLVCSHINQWAIDAENRLNQSNTICFCVLHDKRFDRGYFSLDEKYRIIFGMREDDKLKHCLET